MLCCAVRCGGVRCSAVLVKLKMFLLYKFYISLEEIKNKLFVKNWKVNKKLKQTTVKEFQIYLSYNKLV